MKLVVAAFVFTLFGCSSSKSNDAKPVPATPFGKATAASWLSECFKVDQWYYKETMTLDGVSSGSTSGEYFADKGCTQTINQKGSTTFNYSSKELSDQRSIITIFNPQTKAATSILDVTVLGKGDMMKVAKQNGPVVIYTRVFGESRVGNQTGNAKPGDGIGGGFEGFDRIAVGSWVSNDCQGGANGSYKEYFTFQGNGRATSRYDVYQTSDCSYGFTPTQDQGFSYNVKQFASGAGKVEIAGEVSQVSFPSPAFMNITNAQGKTVLYKRYR